MPRISYMVSEEDFATTEEVWADDLDAQTETVQALIKALNDAGMKVPMYTYYAGVTGTPTATVPRMSEPVIRTVSPGASACAVIGWA